MNDSILAKGVNKIEYMGKSNKAVYSDWQVTKVIELDSSLKQFAGDFQKYNWVIFRVEITEGYQYFAFYK